MKKGFIYSLIVLIIGILIGKYFYMLKDINIKNVFKESETYYFIQEGLYLSKEVMEKDTKDINVKLIEYKNDKYYVYLGVTRDYQIAEKIVDIYKNYNVNIIEKNLSNEEFYNNINQFDILLKNTETNDELLSIEKVVLASYEEIINK